MTHKVPPPNVWAHPAVAVGPSTIEGEGLFTTAGITAGTVVLRLGGRLVSSVALTEILARAAADPAAPYVDTITVHDNAHLVLQGRSLTSPTTVAIRTSGTRARTSSQPGGRSGQGTS